MNVLVEAENKIEFDKRPVLNQEREPYIIILPVFYLKMRRIIEIVFIIFLSPLLLLAFLLISLIVLIDSGLPVFFVQQRVGLQGKKFKIIKFRTIECSDSCSEKYPENDKFKITKSGRFLRKHRLDELPQLINVLFGEMSLIGPRPEMLCQYEVCCKDNPFYSEIKKIRPGITGLSQVNNGYSKNPEEFRIKFKYDMFYITNISLLLDLKIILKTYFVFFSGYGSE
jgi:lipopolysaccharide/colanic/teichoic acid biosynthesis glycosyltransferase